MKILHVINKLSFDGGPSITVPRLCYELRKLGHEVNFWTPGDWLLQDKIAEADVVHLTGIYTRVTFPTLFWCRWYNKALVWSPRGSWQRWSGSRRVGLKRVWDALCRWMAPHHTVIHATSELEAQSVLPVMPRPIRVIGNGVDVPDTLLDKEPSDHLRCLYLGRIDRKKGIEKLLCTMAMLNPSCGITLQIVGDGDPAYVTHLKHEARELRHVRFSGHCRHEQLPYLFAQTDLTIVPSHIESFGQVVVESLAHGVPVLASTGVPFVLHEQGCGVTVDMSSPPIISLLALLTVKQQAPEYLTGMGEMGRRWMKESFTWESKAQEMVSAYEYALSLQSAVI